MPPMGKKPEEPEGGAALAATGPTATTVAVATSTAMRDEGDTLTNEGALDVSAQTGDGGAREAEVSAAQDVFDALGGEIDLGPDAGAIVREATGFVIELFKHRPKPWSHLSKAEQQDLIRGVEHNCHELVRQIVEAVAATRADPIRCLFVGFTDKGDNIKAELTLKASSKEETEKSVLFMHRARGQNVMITLASASEFHRDPAADTSEADQRGLSFEAGSDEHPEDDSDLAEAAGEQPVSDPEDLRHGDAVAFAGSFGRCRIDLKRGWVQFLENGEAELDANWQDMREAKPEELAAERERVADFSESVAEPVEA